VLSNIRISASTGEKVVVKAKIHPLGGFSAQAGQTDLLTWFGAIAPGKPRVVLTHGEDGPRAALAQSQVTPTPLHGLSQKGQRWNPYRW